MALKHNHVVRIAAYKVEEKEHAKDVARSAYFPILRNDSNVLQLTDTQFIGIPAGSIGTVTGTSLPVQQITLNQGGKTLVTSGTSLTQPLTELFRIKPANDIATAELSASRDRAHQTENEVALLVHQIYYRILIAQAHREATQAKIKASEDLKSERLAQVKFGAVLEEEAIESRAQSLEARPPYHRTPTFRPHHTARRRHRPPPYDASHSQCHRPRSQQYLRA
jgi:outer membrane protein TolC